MLQTNPRQPAAIYAAPTDAHRRDEGEVVVHRDEIIDGRMRIAGYRFRAEMLDSLAPVPPTAKVEALEADHLARFAERRLAVVPLKVEEWRGGDFRRFVAPNVIFQVEVPGPAGDVAAWLAGLTEIKAAGARIGLDGIAVSPRLAEAFKLADAVFIRPGDYSVDGFDRLVGGLRRSDARRVVIAEGVYSWSEFRMCIGMGAHHCLGSFAATADAEEKAEPVPQSRLILIEMLNLLRGDADLAELAKVAKRDPGVVLRILEMANSPVAGLKMAAASVDQAIMMLGREALYRWIAVAVFRAGSAGSQGRDGTLLEFALRRSRFLELTGQCRLPQKDSGELFVLGLMSLMDRLLGLPMEQVLARIPLPARIADALLRREGEYAPYLALALAVEKGDAARIAMLAGELSLETARIVEGSAAARVWTEQTLSTE